MSFKAPVGTEEERNSGKIWPGNWFEAVHYCEFYDMNGDKHRDAYHTGADLNWNTPRWDADAHAPVYSIGDGKVTYAQLFSKKYWGNIIIIDHGIVDGKPLFSRYGHVERIQVSLGQLVRTGDQIANVGNGGGLFAYHLHFDISATEQLRTTPQFWPGMDKPGVLHHFVNPQEWLRKLHVVNASPLADNLLTNNNDNVRDIKPSPTAIVWYVIASSGAKVRKSPGLAGEEIGFLPHGIKFALEAGGGNQDGYTWGQISGGEFNGYWLAIFKEDRSESYASTNPPRT